MSQTMTVSPAMEQSAEQIHRNWRLAAKLIDHTLLKPEATRAQLAELCREAVEYGFHAVMVNPGNIVLCVRELRGSGVVVATVIGFPLGATTTTAKLAEATDSLRLGATELDMVMNIGALKSGDHERVRMEMHSMAELCHRRGALLKVILETALLSTEEKIRACQLALDAKADFVKTSTGFGGGGATEADVSLLRGVVGSRCGVKASGGIRTAHDLLAMVEAGASRIGSSSGVAIVRELGAS